MLTAIVMLVFAKELLGAGFHLRGSTASCSLVATGIAVGL